jgi:hypothetical protein
MRERTLHSLASPKKQAGTTYGQTVETAPLIGQLSTALSKVMLLPRT